ncbi:MAG: orotidine-5'-phosphate decarboxylase [Candidatus Desantisbacteria bacterium]
MEKEQARRRLCLALDVDCLDDAVKAAKLLKSKIGIFKIGSQLFTKEGPKAVEVIRKCGGEVFLDLKYHDIPNTVANSVRMAVKLGVYMLNVHASGGSQMMQAAVEGLEEECQKSNVRRPILLAVTVLTSINSIVLSEELRVILGIKDQVQHLAKMSQASGVDGVVASPQEISIIRESCGKDFVILTPGIRPCWGVMADDQKRVTTPAEAIRLGADYIVIGRPILQSNDPVVAAERVLSEMVTQNV